MISKTIVCTETSFSATHRHREAPDALSFLRDWHRHQFRIRVAVASSQEEPLALKARIDAYLSSKYQGDRIDLTCAEMAQDLFVAFAPEYAHVDEGDWNGATVLAGTAVSPPSPQPLPPESVMSEAWVGVQTEGPNRGKPTLFIPGSTSHKGAVRVLDKYHDQIERVHYGAGGDRQFKPRTFDTILDYFPPDKIDVEVDEVTDKVEKVTGHRFKSITVVSRSRSDMDRASFIKSLHLDKIVWTDTMTGEMHESPRS